MKQLKIRQIDLDPNKFFGDYGFMTNALNELKQKYGYFDIFIYCGEGSYDLELYYKEIETDQEYQERLEEEKILEAQKELDRIEAVKKEKLLAEKEAIRIDNIKKQIEELQKLIK